MNSIIKTPTTGRDPFAVEGLSTAFLLDAQSDSDTVIAEDAPIGVQLWPTTSPKGAPNFTLASVSIIRDAYGRHVLWTYESGTTRTFYLGEQIAVRYAA